MDHQNVLLDLFYYAELQEHSYTRDLRYIELCIGILNFPIKLVSLRLSNALVYVCLLIHLEHSYCYEFRKMSYQVCYVQTFGGTEIQHCCIRHIVYNLQVC